MPSANIQLITGVLGHAYRTIQPGTMLHAHQVLKERQTNQEYRTESVSTANGIIYFLDNNIPKLAITTELENLALRHGAQIYSLTNFRNEYHYPNFEEAYASIKAENTTIIDLSLLRLKKWGSKSFASLTINTKNYAKNLQPEERKLIECIYGCDSDIRINMSFLEQYYCTDIYLMDPTYIQTIALPGPIVCSSSLSSGSSYFEAHLLWGRRRLWGVPLNNPQSAITASESLSPKITTPSHQTPLTLNERIAQLAQVYPSVSDYLQRELRENPSLLEHYEHLAVRSPLEID